MPILPEFQLLSDHRPMDHPARRNRALGKLGCRFGNTVGESPICLGASGLTIPFSGRRRLGLNSIEFSSGF